MNRRSPHPRDHDYMAESLQALRRIARPGRAAVGDDLLKMWFALLAGFLFAPAAIYGVYVAYSIRDESRGLVAGIHVERAIKAFWRWAIAWMVGIPLMILGIGFLIIFGAQIYLAVIAVKGLRRTLDGAA